MPRRRPPPDVPRHDAWVIPYADLLTLLLAFFVVMYAVSSVNEGKYRVLSDALSAAFRGTPMRLEPIDPGTPALSGEARPGSSANPRPAGALPRKALPGAPVPSLELIALRVERAMASLVMSDQVIVRRYADRVEIEIRNDLLFDVGSATLSEPAQQVIREVAGTLVGVTNPVRVEGHTDNLPINRPAFPSNWELSAARAAGVVRVMSSAGIEPERLAVLGLGEFRPAAGNDTPEGRNANRRVMIVVLNP